MKKICKRAAALLLAVCLMLPVTAAPALAADSNQTEAATVTVDYALYYSGMDFSSTSNGANLTTEGNRNRLANAYGKETNFMLFDYSSAQNKIPYMSAADSTTAKFEGLMFYSYIGDWIAFKIKSPGAGSFDVSLQYKYVSSNTDGCAVYLFADDGTAAENIANKFTSETLLGTVNLGINLTSASVGKKAFEFNANADYIVVFRAEKDSSGNTEGTGNARMHIAGLTMTRTVSASDVADAISDAPLGTTVTLSAACDVTGEAINVGNGVTVDMNGQYLAADGVNIVIGGSVIDKAEVNGTLSTANLTASGSNGGYLPLKSDAGYQFYQAAMEAKENGTPSQEGNVKVRFKVNFAKPDAYALIANGNTGLTIDGKFGGDSTASGSFRRAEDADAEAFAKAWAEQAVAKNGAVLIYMEFSGLEENTKLTLTPSVTCANVTISGTEQTVQ